MYEYNSLDVFILFLKKEEYKEFLSDNFIALRTTEKNLYTSKELVINHFKSFKKISDIKTQKEDSHYLVYFSSNNKNYILKAKFDSFGLIESMVEEIYNESLNQVVLKLEYDGTNYYGMQKQGNPSYPSIQGEIEKAIKHMIKKDVIVTISSRTDRGVHAKGQVVQFDSNSISPSQYKYALNNLLPKDIRIKDAYLRSQLFNCRYDTVRKEYEYIIDTNEYSVFLKDYVWYTKINNISLIRKELKSLVGTHDFKAFCKGENENTVRTIYEAKVYFRKGKAYFKFIGNGFLHNMIRFIIGSLIEIDKGSKTTIKDLILEKDKNETSKLAPASGLYLINIEY